jgi:hypothetical protein
MAGTVHLTSRVSPQHRAALENLLFFNARQHRVLDGIKYSIERYGAPELVEREGSLRVEVPTLSEVQSLFAVRAEDGKPVGVAVFAREAPDRFVVLHVGVLPDQDSPSPESECRLLLRLLHEVRHAARRVRGVEKVELLYGKARARPLALQ